MKDLVDKMDFPKISEQHKAIIDLVGDCFLSCNNAVESI